MKQASTASFVVSRKATLHEIVRANGIFPLAEAEVRAHMQAELEKAPRATRIGRFIAFFAEPILVAVLTIDLAAMIVGALGLMYSSFRLLDGSASVTVGQIALISVALLTAGWLAMYGLSAAGKALDKRVIALEPARWDREKISISRLWPSSSVVHRAENTAFIVQKRLRACGIDSTAIRHTLRQKTKVLDPVIEIQATGYADSVFVAIYDENTGYCRLAEIV